MFVETYNEDKFKAAGIDIHFPEDDISFSKKNVVRGMHGDTRTWKLITCTRGKIFFVALNGDGTFPLFWEMAIVRSQP